MTHPQRMDDHLESCQPAQLPVVIANGELIGNPPKFFHGDRSKTELFITQFRLFCIINNGNPVITNPKQRVALALTYIRGPKVEAWVAQQCDALSTKVDHTRTHADMDEQALWDDFIAEFKRAFAEPSWKVLARLEELRMDGDEIDMYIANFETLVKRAERQRESRPMMDYFRQGLPTDFVVSIMKWATDIPETIDEWQSAARDEVKSRDRMKLYLGPEQDTRSGLSEEKIGRCMMKGRCFKCNEKGHRARLGDCPNTVEGENIRN